jgi:hypothetical protein
MPNFPEGSIQTIIQFLRGGSDKWSAIAAAYDLLGYGISILRGPSVSMSGMPTTSVNSGVPSNDVVANDLESLVNRVKSRGQESKESKVGQESEESESKKLKTDFPVQLPEYFISFVLQLLMKALTT